MTSIQRTILMKALCFPVELASSDGLAQNMEIVYHTQLATSVLSFTSSKEKFNPIIFPVLALFRACDFCKMNEMRSKFVTNTKQRTNVRSRHSDS